MRFISRKMRLKFKPLFWGSLLGLHLVAAALLAFLPFGLGVQAATTQGPDRAALECFTPQECASEMATGDPKGLCTKSPGCCMVDRCFVPDETCPKIKVEGQEKPTGQGRCYAKSEPFKLAVSLGTKETVVDLADYINSVYKYAVAIASVLAATMMMIGGALYLTAADSERVSRGKEYIVNSLTGLLVVLGAYILLNTINPDTVSLRLPKVAVIKRVEFAGCEKTAFCRPCNKAYWLTEEYLKAEKTGVAQGMGAVLYGEACKKEWISDTSVPGVMCYGKSCGLITEATCSDNSYRCRKPMKAGEKRACPKPPADDANTNAGGTNAGGEEAATVEYGCYTCKSDGLQCTPNGRNDTCCNGFCAANKCSGGMTGDACDPEAGGKDCMSGFCQTNWNNSCSAGIVGSPCGAENKECAPGLICQTVGTNSCSRGERYDWCSNESECAGGNICKKGICVATGDTYEECEASEAGYHCWDFFNPKAINLCPNGATDCYGKVDGSGTSTPICYTGTDLKYCHDGKPGRRCKSDSDCDTASGIKCVTAISTCLDGSDGARCDDNSDCRSNHCYEGGKYKACVSGGPGTRCTPASGCANQLTCAGGKCVWSK